MKKLITNALVSILVVIAVFSFSLAAQAQEGEVTPPANEASFVDKMGHQTDLMRDTAGFGDADIGVISAGIIQAALALLGIIFLIIIVFAGYRWMTASGNEEQVKKAQDAIKRGIIGLVIVILAYAIMVFVFTQLPFDGVVGGTGSDPVGSGQF